MIIFHSILDIRYLFIFIFYFYVSCENPEKLGENPINDPTEIGEENIFLDDEINPSIEIVNGQEISMNDKHNNNIVKPDIDSSSTNDFKYEDHTDGNKLNTFVIKNDKFNKNIQTHDQHVYGDPINYNEKSNPNLNEKEHQETDSQKMAFNNETEPANPVNDHQSREENFKNENINTEKNNIANSNSNKNIIHENNPQKETNNNLKTDSKKVIKSIEEDFINEDIITEKNESNDINNANEFKDNYNDPDTKDLNHVNGKNVLTSNNEPVKIKYLEFDNEKDKYFESNLEDKRQVEGKDEHLENEMLNNQAIKQNMQNEQNIIEDNRKNNLDKTDVFDEKNEIKINQLSNSKIEVQNNPEQKINNLNESGDIQSEQYNMDNNQINLEKPVENEKIMNNNNKNSDDKLDNNYINDEFRNQIKISNKNNNLDDQLVSTNETSHSKNNDINRISSLINTNVNQENDLNFNTLENPLDKSSDSKLSTLDSSDEVAVNGDIENSDNAKVEYLSTIDDAMSNFEPIREKDDVVGDNETNNWLQNILNIFVGVKDQLVMNMNPWINLYIDMLPSSLQGLFHKPPVNIYPASAVTIFFVITFVLFLSIYKIFAHTLKRENDYHKYVENIELISNLQRELLAFKQEADELEKKKSEFEGSSKSLSEESIKMNEKLQKINSSKDKLEATAAEQRNQIKDLNKQLKTQTSLVNEHIKSNKSLQAKLDEITKHSTMVENNLHQSEMTLQKLESQCRDQQKQILEQTEQIKNSTEKMLDDARSKKKRINELVDTNTELQSELIILKESVDEKVIHIKNLEDGFKELRIFEEQLISLSKEDIVDSIDGDNLQQKEQNIALCMKSLLDVAQVRAKYNTAIDENEILKKEFSIESENRLKLEDTIKELQMKADEFVAARIEAEEKVKATNVKMEVLHNYFKEKETDLTRELGEHKVKEKYVANDLSSKDDLVKNMQQSIADLKCRESDLQYELNACTANYNKQISQFEKNIHQMRLDLSKATRDAVEFKNMNVHLNMQLIAAQNKLKAEDANSLPSNSAAISPPLMPIEERPASITYPINPPLLSNIRIPFNPQFIDRNYVGMLPQLRPMHRIPNDVQWRKMNPMMHDKSPQSLKNGRHSSDYARQPLRNDYSPVRINSRGSQRRRGSISPKRSRSDDSRDSSPHSPRRRSPDSPRGRSPGSPRRRSSYSSRSRSPDSPRNRSPVYSRRSNSSRRSSYSSRDRSPDAPRNSKHKKRQRSKSLNSAYKNHGGPVDKPLSDKSSPLSRQIFESPPKLQESFDHGIDL